MKNKFLKVVLLATLMILLVACGKKTQNNSGETNKEKVVIGGTALSQVYYEPLAEKYKEMGYKTEFKMFDSNQIPLEALQNGDIDISIAQHKKYVMSFNKNNNADLDLVKPYGMYTGIGLYSEKYSKIEDIPENGSIAIMNDAMNENIALRILEKSGLIKIDKNAKLATVADIVENKKNLKIKEIEQAQLVSSLSDVDAACIFFTHMSNAKKDPSKYLARDDEMINYPMGPFVKKENVNAKWAVDFAKCYRDKDVQEKIKQLFPGVFEFYTDDSQVSE